MYVATTLIKAGGKSMQRRARGTQYAPGKPLPPSNLRVPRPLLIGLVSSFVDFLFHYAPSLFCAVVCPMSPYSGCILGAG